MVFIHLLIFVTKTQQLTTYPDRPCSVKWPVVSRPHDGLAETINKKELCTLYTYMPDLAVHC